MTIKGTKRTGDKDRTQVSSLASSQTSRRLNLFPVDHLLRLLFIGHLIKDINILRLANSLSYFLALEHQPNYWKERQYAPHTSEEYKFELKSNTLSEENGVEGKCHANFLADEVEQCGNLISVSNRPEFIGFDFTSLLSMR